MTPTAQLVFNKIVRRIHRVGPGLRKPATVALVSFTELALLSIPVQGCRCLIRNWQLAAGSNSIPIFTCCPKRSERVGGQDVTRFLNRFQIRLTAGGLAHTHKFRPMRFADVQNVANWHNTIKSIKCNLLAIA